jgi:16S rRNA (uracil1498-N3)-methyltransferase
VLRLAVGAEISVFDGHGNQYMATIEHVGNREVVVRPTVRLEAAPELPVAIVLAQAVLKADRMDAVVRDAVMLGVSAIQPIVTSRTEIGLASLVKSRRQERWHRIAVASTKQCGRATLATVDPPMTLADWLAHAPELRMILVEPSACSAAPLSLDFLFDRPLPSTATLLVGPEGGWEPAELTAAVGAGFVPVRLGRRTLRADAAPLAALSVLQFIWER